MCLWNFYIFYSGDKIQFIIYHSSDVQKKQLYTKIISVSATDFTRLSHIKIVLQTYTFLKIDLNIIVQLLTRVTDLSHWWSLTVIEIAGAVVVMSDTNRFSVFIVFEVDGNLLVDWLWGECWLDLTAVAANRVCTLDGVTVSLQEDRLLSWLGTCRETAFVTGFLES